MTCIFSFAATATIQGPEAPREFLEVLSGPDRKPFHKGSGRLELAEAIASQDNPLTARVLVNRVWLHHFGSALVATPSDFGLRSDPPTHPELLDYLAARFMDGRLVHQKTAPADHALRPSINKAATTTPPTRKSIRTTSCSGG